LPDAPPGASPNQTVVINFEHFDRDRGVIWLRLHNWTAWSIRVPTQFDLDMLATTTTPAKVPVLDLRYYLEPYDPTSRVQLTTRSGKKHPFDEPAHPPVPEIHPSDLLSESLIPRSESVIFPVPKEHLARNVRLSVTFRYEWENLSVGSLEGPVHSVYYRGVDLPDAVQAEIR